MHYFGLLLFTMALSFAHQTNVNGGGKPIFWPNKSVPLAIRENSQSLNGAVTTQIIKDSIKQWNQASSAQIVENSSATNSVSFERDFSVYGPAVVGVTEISYSGSGAIQKATILLNEQDYCFSASPGFSGTCSKGSKIYLGDVVTHEMGHFLGLSHSEVLDSTMFYSNFPGQSTIGADDKAGVRNKYDTSYGKIFGHVKGGDHVGILGAHVQAISLKTGEVISGISAEDGYFEIGGLDLDDSYFIYTSPLKKLDSLPVYFSNTQNSFCPGSYVGSFFSACGKENEGFPQRIPVSTRSPNVDVGVITINCSLRASEDYNYEKLQSSFSPIDLIGLVDENLERAFVGYFRANEINSNSFSAADKLSMDLRHFSWPGGTQKYLKISLISRTFGNPIEYSLDLTRNGLTEVSGPLLKSLKSPEGTYEVDISAMVPLSATASENLFDLEIKAKKMSALDVRYTIPSSVIFASVQHFPYLITLSVWEQTSSGLRLLHNSEANLSDNKSCLDAPFTYAVASSKGTNDSKSSSVSSSSPAAAIAACGSLGPPDQGGGTASALICLCLGFLLMILLGKSGKNFLS